MRIISLFGLVVGLLAVPAAGCVGDTDDETSSGDLARDDDATAEATAAALSSPAPSCVTWKVVHVSYPSTQVEVHNECQTSLRVSLDLRLQIDPPCQTLPAGGKATFRYYTGQTSVRKVKRC